MLLEWEFEEYVDAHIRATMEVVQVGTSENGLPVYVDKFALKQMR